MVVRFKSVKYSSWSDRISSKFPRIDISPDAAQLYANMMVIVAMLGVIPVFMQCWKVYRSKKSNGVSVYAFMFSLCLSILWLGYALISGNGVQMISSSLSIVAALTLILLSRKYQINESNLALVDGSL